MQLTGMQPPASVDMEQQQQIAFLGSLLAPPISLNGAACMTHNPPQPVQPVLSHSPAEPAPAPVALPPHPSPPLESPLDTAEVLPTSQRYKWCHAYCRIFMSVHAQHALTSAVTDLIRQHGLN